MSRLRAIVLYVLIAFGVSWGYWLWLLAQGQTVGPGSTASHLPGLMGPMVAALVVIALTEGRRGLFDIWARMVRMPTRIGPYLVALAMPPVLAGLVLAIQAFRGVPLPPLAAFVTYPGLPAGAGFWGLIAVLFLNGYGEETGWRGWLFESVQPHYNRFGAALFVALVWMVWHLPLFWLNTSMAALLGPMALGWAFGLAMGSFVLAHLYVMTGRSLGAVVAWHVVYNYCVATEATSGLVAAVVSTAVMIWGAAVAMQWARSAAR